MKSRLSIVFCLFCLGNVIAQGSSHAIEFAGNDAEYIQVSNPSALPTGTSARSMEAWVYRNNASQGGNIVGYGRSWNNGVTGFQFQVLQVLGTYYLFTDGTNSANNITLAANELPSLNEWAHMAITVDNSRNWNYYLNGILIKSGTFSTSFNTPISPDLIRIGQRSDSETVGTGYQGAFNGGIDEVRIWDKELTQTEIRENMCQKLDGTEPNLVAYYRMDEGIDNTCSGGEDVCDLTGNGNHGTKF